MTTLEDFPAEVRDTVRDWGAVFLAGITSPEQITSEAVAAAMEDERSNPRGMAGYWSTRHNWVAHEALQEHLKGTYDEFRSEAGLVGEGSAR